MHAVDKKTIDKIFRLIDKIVRLCQTPRINLKNSPPYILDTLPDIYSYVREILHRYEDSFEVLAEFEYFQVFIHTLADKCKQTMKLFKDSKEKMFDETSQARHKLTKYSLCFSHLLKDIQALFPNHIYTDSFTITKRDAAQWWAQNFGTRTVVTWREFKRTLSETYSRENYNQSQALQSTIDLTCNEHVSIFEFDVFVRLFQPWNNIIETWKALAVTHPGYMAFMTYDEVKAVLNKYINKPGPGSYVFRLSCTKLGQWAIGYVTSDKQILQTIIQNKSLAQALLDGERDGFYKYPNGYQGRTPDLYSLVHLPEVHIEVSQEQYQLYCEIGTTFQLCKICTENDKDIRLEPCRHLLCKPCLITWQSTGDGQSCPFCRREIKGTEEVVIDPFQPVHSKPITADCPDLIDLQDSGSKADSSVKQSELIGLVKMAATNSAVSANNFGAFSTLPASMTNKCPRIPPPPRPPRLADGISPCCSPGSNRAMRALQDSHVDTVPSLETNITSSLGDLNYATLDLKTESDSDDASDLPIAPPPPRSVAESSEFGITSQHTAVPITTLQHNVRQLMQHCDIQEHMARRLLTITNNNLTMSMEILIYFSPRPGL